jgi:hypothetical protein
MIFLFILLSCSSNKQADLKIEIKNYGFRNNIFCEAIYLINLANQDTTYLAPAHDSIFLSGLPLGKYSILYRNIFEDSLLDSVILNKGLNHKIIFVDRYTKKNHSSFSLQNFLRQIDDSIILFVDLGLDSVCEKFTLKKQENSYSYSFFKNDIFVIKDEKLNVKMEAIIDSVLYELEQIGSQKVHCSSIFLEYVIVKQTDTIRIQDKICRWRRYGMLYDLLTIEKR